VQRRTGVCPSALGVLRLFVCLFACLFVCLLAPSLHPAPVLSVVSQSEGARLHRMRRRLLRPAVPAMRARLRRERPVPHSRPPPLDTPARARACSSGRTKGLAAATMDRSEMAGASASKATRATGGSQWHSSNSRAHRCRFDWVGLAVPQRTLLASMASMLGNGFRYRSGGHRRLSCL
jgi:hypothetical protein